MIVLDYEYMQLLLSIIVVDDEAGSGGGRRWCDQVVAVSANI